MTTHSEFEAQPSPRTRATRGTGSCRLLPFLTVFLFVLQTWSASAATITIDASKQTSGNPHFWSAAFGTGRAVLALRGDWQTHQKIGNRELGAKRVRGHGLLSDDGTNNELGLWVEGCFLSG